MKILVFGDLFWRTWRNALIQNISKLRAKHKPDFVIVNWENVSSWRGPIEKHMKELQNIWVDLFTSWDHFWDNEKNLLPYLERKDCKLIRPANYYESDFYKLPWEGYKVLEQWWMKLLVINLLSETFTRDNVYNPFLKVDSILKKYEKKGILLNWIIIDFHKEVTSEWYTMQEFLDWRVSFIFWTHTHVQTNDEQISELWTGLISDIWMIWPKRSIIWSDYWCLKKRFLTGLNKWKIEQSSDKNFVINWAVIEIDEKTMKCTNIEKIREYWILD